MGIQNIVAVQCQVRMNKYTIILINTNAKSDVGINQYLYPYRADGLMIVPFLRQCFKVLTLDHCACGKNDIASKRAALYYDS